MTMDFSKSVPQFPEKHSNRLSKGATSLTFSANFRETDRLQSSSASSQAEDLREAFADNGLRKDMDFIGGSNDN